MKIRRDLQELLALASFLSILICSALWIQINASNVLDQRKQLINEEKTLERWKNYKAGDPARAQANSKDLPGPAFLEGDTQTIAGAQLQSSVVGSITAAGGIVSSSQLQLQPEGSSDQTLRLTANFEIPYAKLPSLLYKLEAGLPFLFVETMNIGISQGDAGAEKPVTASFTISGVWQRGKT